MKHEYRKIMDRVKLTDSMRDEVLKNALAAASEQPPEGKRSSAPRSATKRWRHGLVAGICAGAAAFACLFALPAVNSNRNAPPERDLVSSVAGSLLTPTTPDGVIEEAAPADSAAGETPWEIDADGALTPAEMGPTSAAGAAASRTPARETARPQRPSVSSVPQRPVSSQKTPPPQYVGGEPAAPNGEGVDELPPDQGPDTGGMPIPDPDTAGAAPSTSLPAAAVVPAHEAIPAGTQAPPATAVAPIIAAGGEPSDIVGGEGTVGPDTISPVVATVSSHEAGVVPPEMTETTTSTEESPSPSPPASQDTEPTAGPTYVPAPPPEEPPEPPVPDVVEP